jgi:hypothetical protein
MRLDEEWVVHGEHGVEFLARSGGGRFPGGIDSERTLGFGSYIITKELKWARDLSLGFQSCW